MQVPKQEHMKVGGGMQVCMRYPLHHHHRKYDETTDNQPTDRGLKRRTGSSCARCKVNWLSVRDVHETTTRWQGDTGTGQHHLADP